MNYDPACLHCRREAGRDPAKTTGLCYGHLLADRDRLAAELAAGAKVTAQQCDLARQAEMERDAALAKLAASEARCAMAVEALQQVSDSADRVPNGWEIPDAVMESYVEPAFAAIDAALAQKPCATCGGAGYVTVPAHDPRCDGMCTVGCPVPTQEPCPNCAALDGEGKP